jgi:hypothetical protein
VVAALDGSAYLAGVCDHAAWLAGACDAPVDLLLVQEAVQRDAAARSSSQRRTTRPSAVLADAALRLREQGLDDLATHQVQGRFDVVAPPFADRSRAMVLGRRGRASSRTRPNSVGRNVLPLLRRTVAPICVAPKVFLPIQRAVVLLEDQIGDEDLAALLATCPWLDGVEVTSARATRSCGQIGLECLGQPGHAGASRNFAMPNACASDLIVVPRRGLDECLGGVYALVLELLKRSKAPLLFL